MLSNLSLSENSAYVTQRLRCNQYSLGILEGYFICTQGHRARDIYLMLVDLLIAFK